MNLHHEHSPEAPLVSIGLPVYNGRRHLRHAVLSILNQAYTNWELIIVDDASTDNSLETIADIVDNRIKVTRHSDNLGRAARLNEAVDQAKGEYFARMDQDDIAYPDRLAKQVAFLQQHPNVDLTASSVTVFKDNGSLIGIRTVPTSHKEICRNQQRFMMPHPTWMGKKAWFLANPYDENVFIEDKDLLSRTFQQSTFANIPKPLLGYREENLTVSKMLKYRLVAISVAKNNWKQRRFLSAVSVIVMNMVKAIVDIVAISTRLNYRILRHRASPPSRQISDEWQNVYNNIITEDGSRLTTK